MQARETDLKWWGKYHKDAYFNKNHERILGPYHTWLTSNISKKSAILTFRQSLNYVKICLKLIKTAEFTMASVQKCNVSKRFFLEVGEKKISLNLFTTLRLTTELFIQNCNCAFLLRAMELTDTRLCHMFYKCFKVC